MRILRKARDEEKKALAGKNFRTLKKMYVDLEIFCRASDRVRKKFGNYAALLGLIMRQERSIMRQIMRFHFS